MPKLNRMNDVTVWALKNDSRFFFDMNVIKNLTDWNNNWGCYRLEIFNRLIETVCLVD